MVDVSNFKQGGSLTMNAAQQAAVDDAERGANLFITGSAGVGKSEVVKRIVEVLTLQGRKVGITASTGIAAVSVGGLTIHAFCGLGISGNKRDAIKFLRPGTLDQVQSYIGDVDTIIIDEISMLTGDYLDMLDWWLNMVRETPAGGPIPFGGYQIIFVGDFLQLPPVIPEPKLVTYKYAFEAKAWKRAKVRTHELQECFRTADAEMFRHLNLIRRGVVRPETAEFFAPCVRRKLPDPTVLTSTNDEAYNINCDKLRDHEGEVLSFTANCSGNEKFLAKLIDGCPADEVLEIKIGAPVLFLKNNRQAGYFNGMRGRVASVGKDEIHVTTRSGTTLVVERVKWEMVNGQRRVLASMQQFPLKLAWAVTIHRSQGLSLELMKCDLSGTFARGQSYVALSRARTLDGLSLKTPLKQIHVKASKKVVEWYAAQAKILRENPIAAVDRRPAFCSVCGELQRSTSGGMVCAKGHGGADSLTAAAVQRKFKGDGDEDVVTTYSLGKRGGPPSPFLSHTSPTPSVEDPDDEPPF